MNRRTVLIAAGLLVACPAFAEEGWLGISVSVTGEGRFWNPVVHEIVVSGVAEGSPAAASPIVAGDQIVAVDGIVVDGKRARELQPHFEKERGETVTLVLRNAAGEKFTVELVSARRPAD